MSTPTKSRPRPRADSLRKSPTGDRTAQARETAIPAEKISRPPVGHADEGAPLVQRAVEALRKKILSVPHDNPFLGSEDELIATLGISRPTFRQAARLLEHEQLLKIKRGSGGGFFAQAPSARAVSRMAAIYLNSQGTTLQQIHNAFGPLVIEAAALAAGTANEATRSRLTDFVQSHDGFEELDDERLQMRVVLEFERLLGDICGNPAVALMLSVMRDLVRDPRFGNVGLTRDRARSYAEFHRKLAEAVRLGDADMARLFVRAHMAELARWKPVASRARRDADVTHAVTAGD
ncbi:FadR/GntR family transcriptional regulator [Paraburkholderia dinghuensis]|uniref:FadR family transcriptional regulator n=1 Tax=Paraburkholderia dinghuensis TaxID=2305225 RepID=A0A3N6N359_9BURK|nr:FCD domain-containing protein [Paraburkholderia dinghuensis]RQH05041.1 FadR family transcriptional regulator [Paraburkholderia dinghuensis]